MKTTRTNEPRFLLSAGAVAVLVLTNGAAAQEAPMQRVEVTGSSIKRLASENALPLTTIKAEELTSRGLTTMSEVAVALTVASTNEPVGGGGGGTMINMRGLNTNRTLVLLNGRRLANEALGDSSVNVDSIPMAAIDRVEVLRDGASSLYGTDAIAGVVNFITKKQIKDVSLSASAVQPQHKGGGEQRRFGFVAGHSAPGAHVDLRLEMDVLVVLSTAPHPLDPRPEYQPGKVGLVAWQSGTAGADDPCRNSCPENRRGYANTELIYR